MHNLKEIRKDYSKFEKDLEKRSVKIDFNNLKNLDELNKKESHKLDMAIKVMKMIGIKVKRKNNDIEIYGNSHLQLDRKFHIKNFMKDHRIFMMSVIAALTFGGNMWVINDKDSINTSFPSFLKILRKPGAKIS